MVVLREEFDDWAILFNPDTAETFGINPTGVEVWKSMDGKHMIMDIASELDSRFTDVSKDVMQQVLAFVEVLFDLGFAGFEHKNNR